MKAIILAAGIGSRLSSITNKKPKCLIRVGGLSILSHQIDAYKKAGITEIIILAGYLSNQIIEYCNNLYPEIKVVVNPDYKVTNNMY
jgi:L-glutamine-phosphate cytidylyltransferase